MPARESERTLIYRTRLPVRLWHWVNALCIFIMLMSGAMIFNAHPRLYWGKFGANPDHPWLVIGNRGTQGFLMLGDHEVPTTGVLGYAQGTDVAFPPLVTIPSSYNLAAAREWHFFFAWVLVLSGLMFVTYAVLSRHLWRDLALTREESSLRHLWNDVKNHARLRFPKGEAARAYNPLQKIAYLTVIFALIPLVVLTGLTMSPAINAAWPYLLDLFGGRQSARSIHFLCAAALAAFIAVHLLMVVLAGTFSELRSMVTGWYKLPAEKRP
ncbi:cytochrome b/b6 domain-containing protein [Novosphingobium sp. KCTC 2891]|uniref:cytochrome b/b6 domain-containing protein n=1 Tax=Novosphingobium sp. KCTC 2891 TaxID=2989730 RepID=UPI002222B900|nr:cytochrome b/b6 domain-containing protein [Novosphingobium sp. KCTC 2891]MCW1384229.1 cytochrome b/b6 domain-containing protein [Novosphingobium sp. KCTC 2891]